MVERLRDELGLGEPFADPAVAHFGLRNAVFALGDTFLEVVSPQRPDTAAGRLLARRGGDCGYMLMFQVQCLAAARRRAEQLAIREVFEVQLDDIAEVHLHPADMPGGIVSLSAPQPPEEWRWGGPNWRGRSVPARVAGARIATRDPARTSERWSTLLGVPAAELGIEFVRDEDDLGLVEIVIAADAARTPLEIGKVRLVVAR